MFIRLALVILVVMLLGAQDHEDFSSVREQETALAKALQQKNKVAILALTARDFHVYLTCGSVVLNRSTDVLRQDWITGIRKLPSSSYKVTVSNIQLLHAKRATNELPNSSMANATLEELWTIRSPQGGQIERHFLVHDTWVKLQGTWKLAQRAYLPHPCTEG